MQDRERAFTYGQDVVLLHHPTSPAAHLWNLLFPVVHFARTAVLASSLVCLIRFAIEPFVLVFLRFVEMPSAAHLQQVNNEYVQNMSQIVTTKDWRMLSSRFVSLDQ